MSSVLSIKFLESMGGEWNGDIISGGSPKHR